MSWAASLGVCHGERTLNSVFATIYHQCKRDHIIFLISFPSTSLTMSLHLISLIWIPECCINISVYVEKGVWIMPCSKSKKTPISNILSKSNALPCKWVHTMKELNELWVFCLLGICICGDIFLLFALNSTEIGRWGSDTKWNEEKKVPTR